MSKWRKAVVANFNRIDIQTLNSEKENVLFFKQKSKNYEFSFFLFLFFYLCKVFAYSFVCGRQIHFSLDTLSQLKRIWPASLRFATHLAQCYSFCK